VAAPAVFVQAQPVKPGAEGPLAALLAPGPGKHICFARRYDTAHMRAHPAQRVRSMGLRLAYHAHAPDAFYPQGQRNYYFQLRATLRDGRALATGGECAPAGEHGEVIRCGVDDDGSAVLIRPATGGSLTVDLQATGRIRMSAGESDFDLMPGADDGTFLLAARPAGECPAYEHWQD
jgi:hypothetical protein